MAVIRGTSKEASATFKVPWYVTVGANAHKLTRELTATNARERNQLAQSLDHYLQFRLDTYGIGHKGSISRTL